MTRRPSFSVRIQEALRNRDWKEADRLTVLSRIERMAEQSHGIGYLDLERAAREILDQLDPLPSDDEKDDAWDALATVSKYADVWDDDDEPMPRLEATLAAPSIFVSRTLTIVMDTTDKLQVAVQGLGNLYTITTSETGGSIDVEIHDDANDRIIDSNTHTLE